MASFGLLVRRNGVFYAYVLIAVPTFYIKIPLPIKDHLSVPVVLYQITLDEIEKIHI